MDVLAVAALGLIGLSAVVFVIFIVYRDQIWRKRERACWHHDRKPWSKGVTGDSTSYIREELIDVGMRKRFWCDRSSGGCGQQWFT